MSRSLASGRVTPDDFADVLSAAKAGDDAAVTQLYRDAVPRVLGYVRAQGAPDAEDVVSEVFVSMVRNLGTFDGDEDDFRGWLFTIAHRRVVDDRRRRGRRLEAPASLEVLDDAGGIGGDGETEALGRLRARGVLEVVDDLTPDQRTVLLLRVLADLPIAEIATIVGKGEPAVKALLRRGLASLGRRIEDDGEVEP
jgi:RNA polymerase sigma factor (sigma-70 family)